MIVLTPQFATLLLLVATAQAAFIPQRPASETQVHFRTRSTPTELSPLDYLQSLNPLRSILISRRSTAAPSSPVLGSKEIGSKKPQSKGRGRGRFGASIPAPIPDSAKPASERKPHNATVVGHKPSIATPLKAADFSEAPERHTEGEHHSEYRKGGYKGYKGEHSGGRDSEHFIDQNDTRFNSQRGEPSVGGRRIYNGEESKGRYSSHENKRKSLQGSLGSLKRRSHEPENLPAHPHFHSRLFSRLGDDLPTRLYAKAVDDHDHDHVHSHEHEHDHIHDHEHDHIHDHDHDHDDDHDHDHNHDHNRRDLDVDFVLGPDVSATLDTRGLHTDGRQHTRDWNENLIELEADINVKREHSDARPPRVATKKAALHTRRHYPLIIHNVGHIHDHKHTTYRGRGKRNDHPHHKDKHDHEFDHVHEHIHDRRDAPSGVPGFIQVVSPTIEGPSVKIASLVLTGVTNTTGPAKNASFVLNASNDTQTKVFLVNTDKAPTNDISHVAIQVPMFDRMQVEDVPYCVTYDSIPSAPGPLTVKTCKNSPDPHQSQLFKYSSILGSLEPIWQSTIGDVSDIPSEVSEQLPFERESIVNEAAASNFAMTSKSNATINSTSTAPVSNMSNVTHPTSNDAIAPPRSVALLFAPEDPLAPKAASEDPIPSNRTTTSLPQAASTGSSSTSTKQSTSTANASTALAQAVSVSASSKSASPTAHASTASKSSAGASAAAATPFSSTTSSSSIGSATSSKILAADISSTSTDASASSTATARVADAAAPYEWMFTPGEHV